MTRLKLGVLISGRGSNLQALIDACADPEFPAEIVVVISNKENAAGLERARKAGIKAAIIRHSDFVDRAAFDDALDARLRSSGVQLVCLAGFMRLLTPGFVTGWGDNIINVHPSLLPAFRGAHAHADAIKAGVRISGCTVHIVRPEMDSGPILVQAAVPVLTNDTEETLAARVLKAEHRCVPFAVRAIAEGRVTIDGARATIHAAPTDPQVYLMNPPVLEA